MLPGLLRRLRRQGQGKKLTEAARLLARGELDVTTDHDAEPHDDVDQALAAFGLRLADDAPQRERVFYLWPENLRAFNAWMRVQTQWRVGGMGTPTGLDYAGVEACIRMARLAPPRRVRSLLAELQVMERSTLATWAEQQREHATRSRPRR